MATYYNFWVRTETMTNEPMKGAKMNILECLDMLNGYCKLLHQQGYTIVDASMYRIVDTECGVTTSGKPVTK